MTTIATSKIGTNNQIPSGYGVIEHVRVLIEEWFPGVDLEVIATSGPGVKDSFGRDVPSDDGWLRFNLIASYGVGENRTSYMTSLTYKNFCEGEIGRMLGGLSVTHEARNMLNRQLHQTDALPEGIERATYKRATTAALDCVPLFGWSPTK